MAKQSGLGDALYVDGYDLSGDIASLSRVGGGPALLDVTGISQSGMARIGGIRDGAIEATSYFNPASSQAHPVLSALPTTDAYLMYCRGTTAGAPAACTVAKQINYDGTRGNDGSLTFAVSAQSNRYGIEWSKLLTAAPRTDTAATNGTSLDLGTGSTTYGLQAWLQVTAFTGTDVTITIEESSDDGVGDAWTAVTGGAFTEVTAAPAYERLATSRTQTVERYLRVATSTTGGFSSLVFVVAVARNATTVAF